MLTRIGHRKHGTTRGSPRRSRTAKALRITGSAGKSRRACEWGGWGRVSVDGPGQYNPDRSEGPWGRVSATRSNGGARRATASRPRSGGRSGEREHEEWTQTEASEGYAGSSLTGAGRGKAPFDKPALEPYRGKPAVRNLREDDGDVGIIRSPVRAIVLPGSP
jgi:hypothetical protein